MNISLQSLRPVGNPICLHKESLNYTHFDETDVEFYQSGTAALAAALIAAKQVRTETQTSYKVLLPAYACPDLISACHFAGVKPILIDLKPGSCWMSTEQIEAAICKHTIAIIAVRFLGIAERMGILRAICNKHNLVLIEDSAQGFPVTNPEVYWQGDITILSFGRGKPVNLLGGGAVLSKNNLLIQNLPIANPKHNSILAPIKYLTKVFLYNILIRSLIYGMATRLPGLKIGETLYKPLLNISEIPASIRARINTNIKLYKNLTNNSSAIHSRLCSLDISGLIDLPKHCQHNFSNPLLRYPLLINDIEIRNTLYRKLGNLGASLMYQKPLYKISGIPEHIFDNQNKMTNAEVFAQSLITLPTHAGVTEIIQDEIFRIIRQVVN